MASGSSSCVFCRIVSGEESCSKVFEDELTFAFMDVNPLSKGHVLVIPKRHCMKFDELPPEDMVSIGPALVRIAKALKEALQVQDYNLLQNNGSMAHQVVKHVHFHLIPKTMSSGLGLKWPSSRSSRTDLERVASEIRNCIQ